MNAAVPSSAFAGKVALVIGASRGIGAVTAQAFAAAGAAVGLAARDQTALDDVADGIRTAGGAALTIRTDVTDPRTVERAVGATVAEFGRLDAAFNNATDGPMPAPIVDTDLEGFDLAIRANLHGTFYGMKYQIPALLESGGGAIVNMASGAGLTGVANLGGYTAGKAGIIALTKVAALENADLGVRVNVVAPGAILTHHLQAAGAEAQRQAAAAAPMRRVGAATEVADTVLWLCSDAASYLTGIVVPIDGGQSAGLKPERMYRRGEAMASPDVDPAASP